VKIIIADDEHLVRVSLSSMIKEMETSWQIVSEATNGEELLEQIAEHQPNIAIVDIRMPKMNGLEAIRTGRTISPLTQWVILSGFSDFSYARQALKLGVSEYLLKPVDPAELEKALQHIGRNNKEYIVLLNQQFENNLISLSHGLTSIGQEECDSLLRKGKFTGWTFIFDTAQPASKALEIQRQCYGELRQCLEDHLVYGMNLALLALPNGDLAAVGAWDPMVSLEGERRVSDFFRSAEEIVKSYRNGDMTVTVLKTGECQGFAMLGERLQQLQQWSGLRAVCGIGRHLDYAELKKEAETPGMAEAGRLLCSVLHHLQDWKYLNYQHAVNDLEAVLQNSVLLASEKVLHAVRQFLCYALGISLPGQATAALMAERLRQHGEQVLREKGRSEGDSPDLVKQVIQYIEKHYMDEIGIGQIASQLNVSANYLSTLFHKKTGVTFMKYLTRIRMLKAKELLLNTNLQIKQVAEEVGYYSTRHFTKLFTQTFGSYPSDYRKSQPFSADDSGVV